MSNLTVARSASALCLLMALSLPAPKAHAQGVQPTQLQRPAVAKVRMTPPVQPIALAPVSDAVIGARLEGFAKANAGNAQAMSALRGAAAQVKRDPAHYRSGDGLEMRALNGLLESRFGPAGLVAIPTATAARRGGVRVAVGDVTGISNEESEELGLLVLMEAIRSTRRDREVLSAAGETESLRMQLAMDRLSKLESMLSNIMKKSSETSSTIIQNIK